MVDLLVSARCLYRSRPADALYPEALMYVGLGTVLLILIIVAIVLLLRRGL